MKLSFLIGGLASAVVLLAAPAWGCQICIPMPAESLADRILHAEKLILAREDPDEPYTLKDVAVLKRGSSQTPPLDLFLDSSTRRQLSMDADAVILCAWIPGKEEWIRLGYYDKTLSPVVDYILKHQDEWSGNPLERVRYFARFLGQEEMALSDLAHLELARAPYGQLMQFAGCLPREVLLNRLGNLRRIEWHALYILFLGRSGEEADHELIRRKITECAQRGSVSRTAALATALIEADGKAGIARLCELYLDGSTHDAREMAAIHAALRVHFDEGRHDLREDIVSAYGSSRLWPPHWLTTSPAGSASIMPPPSRLF